MVEILLISPYVNHVGLVAQEKGRRAGNFRLMALIFWCLGELLGLFCGLILVPLSEPISLLVIYLTALVGAGAGAGLAYSIVHSLKTDLAQATH